MKILITGGNGLLGRELCAHLNVQHEIYSLVRKPITDVISGVRYLSIDLARSLDVSLLPKSIDAVIHLAQSSEFRNFPNGARDTFDVNASSTLDLLEYCRLAGGTKFVLASTGGVYQGQNTPISEAGVLTPPSQMGFYFASKLTAEMLASTYRPYFDVNVLRLFFMFGPGQRADMFLPRLVHMVLQGRPVQVDHRGGIRVNPLAAKDAAVLIRTLLEQKPPPVLNVAGKDVVSIQEIANAIGEITRRKVAFEIGNSSQDLVADISAMLELVPLTRITPFTVALEELVHYVISKDDH